MVSRSRGAQAVSGSQVNSAAALLQRKCACGGSPGVGGECAECRAKRLDLKRQAAAPSDVATVPPIVHEVLRTPGRPLDGETRAFMEPRFGHDFSRVRIHVDARAAGAARSVGALAFTAGSRVVFDAGRFEPGSPAGLRLLAHELAHVVQQGEGPALPRSISPVNDPAEGVADAIAERVVSGRGAALAPPSAPARADFSAGARLQRAVAEKKVGCHKAGIPSLGLSGEDAVDAISTANDDAIKLCQDAEDKLSTERLTYSPATVDANFATILREELGLDMANAKHRALTEVIGKRFNLVRTKVLESDFTGYTCLGAANVHLATGTPHAAAGACCDNATTRACSASGVGHIVLCRPWWTGRVDLRAGTLVHEPMHVYFHLADYTTKLNDAHCYTAFVERLGGIVPFVSCARRRRGSP